MTGAKGLRLLLARHGETDWNAERRLQGWAEVPLNARGCEQARRLALRLTDEPIARIFASDLARARETAEVLAAPHGLAVETDPRLREQNYGEWEGRVLPDFSRRDPEFHRLRAEPEFRPPGGESKDDLRHRVLDFVAERLREAREETILVVCHGGPLLVFAFEALEMAWRARKPFYARNGGLTEFRREEEGWRLVTFDEAFHLRGV